MAKRLLQKVLIGFRDHIMAAKPNNVLIALGQNEFV